MSYTNGGIFDAGGVSMPSPLVAAHSQYPSRYHGSTFFQPQSVARYRENPLVVPGLGEFQLNVACWAGSVPGEEWQRVAFCAAVGAAIGVAAGAIGGGAMAPKAAAAAALKPNMGPMGKGAIGGGVVGAIAGALLCQFGKCQRPSAPKVDTTPMTVVTPATAPAAAPPALVQFHPFKPAAPAPAPALVQFKPFKPAAPSDADLYNIR